MVSFSNVKFTFYNNVLNSFKKKTPNWHVSVPVVELSNKQVTEMCITYKWGIQQYLGRTRFCSAVPQSVISACLLDVSQSLQNKPATNVGEQLQKKKGKSHGTTTKDNQNIKQKDVTNGKEPRLAGPHTYLFFILNF